MELDEFHVREPYSGAMRDCVAVAGRNRWVRRIPVDLPASSRRKHGRVGNYFDRDACSRRPDAATDSIGNDQVEDAGFLQNGDVLRFSDECDQCSRDFRPRLVAMRVDDPPPGVCRLFPELEVAAWLQIEVRAGSVELPYAGGAFLDEHFDRF
jgi:hypothetical protein